MGGQRILGRRRLLDDDKICFGDTAVTYRCPAEGSTVLTVSPSRRLTASDLTSRQQAILVALCRPYKAGMSFTAPATNAEIGKEVGLGIDAVKGHLGVLYHRFDIAHLKKNEKRARLVECALQWGLVSERDL